MENIFSDIELSSLELSLHKWELPIKYAYKIKEWAKAWSEIENIRSQKYWSHAEAELLEKNIELYLDELWNPKEVCFFDFWCGVWDTVKSTIKKCIKKWIKINYHWFDISPQVILLAKTNIWSLWKQINFNSSILDFEITNLYTKVNSIRNKYNNIPVLWFILWNTIWNFDSVERILINIMSSFRIEDRLVLWIQKANKNTDEVLNDYRLYEIEKFSTSLVTFLWLSKSDYNFVVFYNKWKSMIEWYITLLKDSKINLNKNIINLKKWKKILVMKSKKMNELGLSKLFIDLDYRIANLRTNKQDTFVQVMIWNKIYN